MAVKSKQKNNKILLLAYLFLIPQMGMILFAFLFVMKEVNLPSISYVQVTSLTCLGIIISFFMYLSILRSRQFEKLDILFMIFIIIDTFYMFSDFVYWTVNGNPSFYILNIIANLIYCICPVFLTIIFWILMDILIRRPDSLYRIFSMVFYLAALVSMLFLFGNLFGKYYYFISPVSGIYQRGPLYNLYVIFPTLMFMICLVYIALSSLPLNRKLILMSYPILPFVGMVVRLLFNGNANLLSIETFCAVTFFYTNMYVRRVNELSGRSRALTESRLRALQLQINPHFLYNTLSSAASLCDSNPEEAQEMIYLLSDYLRDNYSDISKPSVIPFPEEIDHLNHYLSIEKIRFPGIHIQYDLQSVDFNIPGMTLQPLVENSIRHGFRKRRGRIGTILISSCKTEDGWEVAVTDDGIGFFETEDKDEENRHIGIRNVRTRLELLCDGRLTVESVPGKGTVCLIFIPEK